MKKNYLCCIRIETELHDNLKKQAEDLNMSLSELCRQKIKGQTQLTRIEGMLEEIKKKLKSN